MFSYAFQNTNGELLMTKLFGTNGIRGVVNEDMNCELASVPIATFGFLIVFFK